MGRSRERADLKLKLSEALIIAVPIAVVIFYTCHTIVNWFPCILVTLWVTFYRPRIKKHSEAKDDVQWYLELLFDFVIWGSIFWTVKTILLFLWAIITSLVRGIVMMDFLYLGLVYLAMSFGWRVYCRKSAEIERITKLENDRRISERTMNHTLQMAKLKARTEIEVAKAALKTAKMEKKTEMLRLKVTTNIFETLHVLESKHFLKICRKMKLYILDKEGH